MQKFTLLTGILLACSLASVAQSPIAMHYEETAPILPNTTRMEIYEYDAYGRRVYELHSRFFNAQSAWLDRSEFRTGYYYAHKPDTVHETKLDGTGQEWRTLSSYTGSGALAQVRMQGLSPAGDWLNMERTVYTYDTDEKLLYETRELWEDTLADWKPASRFTYAYYLNGSVRKRSQYSYSGATAGWELERTFTYTYTAGGKLETELEYTGSDPAQLYLVSRNTYTYNAQNLISEKLTEIWYLSGAFFYNGDRLLYTYNPDKSLYRITAQNWNTATENWEDRNFTTYTYANTLSSESVSSPTISLYPNPVSDLLHINLPEDTETQLRVINLSGQTLLAETVSGTKAQLNVQMLPAGIYILHLQHAKGATDIRFVKAGGY